jgi:hypothetical protein
MLLKWVDENHNTINDFSYKLGLNTAILHHNKDVCETGMHFAFFCDIYQWNLYHHEVLALGTLDANSNVLFGYKKIAVDLIHITRFVHHDSVVC